MAQKCRKVKRRTNYEGEANPLTGLVICAGCGSRMYRHKRKSFQHDSDDFYSCPKYNKYPKKCTLHFTRTSVLEELTLSAIRTVSTYVKDNEEQFIQSVQEMFDLQSAETAKVQQRQLAQSKKRHKELDSLIKQLYEDKVKGELSAKRFEILSSGYETEQEGLEQQITELEEVLAAYSSESNNTEQFIKLVHRYIEIPELTGTMLNEYIDKIVVHEADRSNGRREQTIEIHFNFIGQYIIPGQEEPEPFNKVEHKRKQWREIYYRAQERLLSGPPEELQEFIEKRKAYHREYRRKKREEREKAKTLATAS